MEVSEFIPDIGGGNFLTRQKKKRKATFCHIAKKIYKIDTHPRKRLKHL